MQASPFQIVSIDILVLATPETCDGWAAFPRRDKGSSRVARVNVSKDYIHVSGGLDEETLHLPVRAIENREILRADGQNGQSKGKLAPQDWDFIRAVKLLFRAEEAQDDGAVQEAYRLVSPLLFGRAQSNHDKAVLESLIPSLRFHSIGSDLDILISHALHQAYFVSWLRWKLAHQDATVPVRQRRAIGIFCPDYKTAILAKLILGPVRICFRCLTPFLPKTARQNCCTTKCANSTRLSRWRAKKQSMV
jgi:hypothetical protein